MWQVLAGGWQALVRLGASTILARALVPGDFGLFGMALLVIELVDYLGGLGMTGGLIAKKDIGDKELNTCFWTMAGVRFLLFCIAFVSAPLAAVFMKEPRVEEIIKVVSCTFLLSILGLIGNSILNKNLQFGKIAIINVIAILIESSLAVYLAKTTTLRYWALVYPMLVSSLFTNLSIFFVAKWFPKLVFDKESFRFQFRFGIHGLGFNIAHYFHQNLDYFIVGKIMGSTSLGLYEYAYRIPHIILDRLARPVGAVVFPALAKLDGNNESIMNGYIETIRYVTFAAFPILAGLAVLSEHLVLVLWGEQWQSIVYPMQLLCLCAAIRCSVQPIAAIFLCKCRPEIPLKQAILSCVTTALFVSIGIYYMGINGVALGMVLSSMSYLYSVIYAHKITNQGYKLLYRALIPNICCSLLSYFICYLLLAIFGFSGLGLKVLIFLALLYSSSYILFQFVLFNSSTKKIFNNIGHIITNNYYKA